MLDIIPAILRKVNNRYDNIYVAINFELQTDEYLLANVCVSHLSYLLCYLSLQGICPLDPSIQQSATAVESEPPAVTLNLYIMSSLISGSVHDCLSCTDQVKPFKCLLQF